MRALPDETEAAIRRMENVDHALWLGWRVRVDAALSMAHQLETGSDSFKAQYSEVETRLLELVADHLDRNEPPVHIEPDAIAQASELVSQLLDALEDVEDDDTRGLLIRHALRLQAALTPREGERCRRCPRSVPRLRSRPRGCLERTA